MAPVAGALVLGFTIIVMLGIQALLLGIIHLIQALRGAGWGIGVLGIINIIFGVILLSNTIIGMASLPLIIGIFAVMGGIAAIYMSLRLRSA
jgi:uncharacterized membrane protein HdeD (DUF308 family)